MVVISRDELVAVLDQLGTDRVQAGLPFQGSRAEASAGDRA